MPRAQLLCLLQRSVSVWVLNWSLLRQGVLPVSVSVMHRRSCRRVSTAFGFV